MSSEAQGEPDAYGAIGADTRRDRDRRGRVGRFLCVKEVEQRGRAGADVGGSDDVGGPVAILSDASDSDRGRRRVGRYHRPPRVVEWRRSV